MSIVGIDIGGTFTDLVGYQQGAIVTSKCSTVPADPTEGAALGRAILDQLIRIGCRAMVTTHLGDLKTYAFANDKAENAAVAIAAVEAFIGGGAVRLADEVVDGLATTTSPGRLQTIGTEPTVIVDADPTSASFMTELKRTPVGINPRAVAVDPNNEDVFILCPGDNSISIVDTAARKALAEIKVGSIPKRLLEAWVPSERNASATRPGRGSRVERR